ncbi:cellobiose transport system substrate-binding protein [Cryobacterium mesophilum]|uniref:Extracellular solute-binding protein n=1 Tax=Terrimesophilobacter mesophilus TaxID=433647 RepID=A0A4R8V9B3_9MICO|nr:extracellular solute-binding protein [Terrimesophilobacter mesophilus]MBB5632994.1 cellobiose transport system substrate-binding protein [Terrimesophilobacter mesophilus]TFB79761.1 extracellular solute-binding protein [Terrimesophilobacter mesophilus]
MKLSRRTKAGAAVAAAAALALVATGCSQSPAADDDGPITLTVTTFGTMGLDGLYAQYEKDHPNITIKATNIDTGGNALTDWKTKQAAGNGLPDIQAVEEGWLGQVMGVSDSFVDLRDFGANDIKDRWVPWKLGQATDPKGRIIGYGTDIGPEGLCYNSKLFEAAGLPGDRAAVAELLGGSGATWEKFFEVGKQYHAATGKAWYDQSGFVWNAMVNQQTEGYYTKSGELNVKDNATLQGLWAQLADGAKSGLSSNQSQWDWGGGKAFTDGSFATFMCPGWMLGVVKGQVEAAGGDGSSGWDFADVFPGGAANWGGSFLTVPTTSKHQKAAAELAAWLTDVPQEVAAFQAAGTFPSVVKAQSDAGVTGSSDLTKFFNDAPVGQILGSRATGVVAQFKGPDDSIIQEQVFGPSVKEIDSGTDGTTAWNDAMKLLDQLVVNK